jgi:hypothetical protein
MTNFRYLAELAGNPFRTGRHQAHDVLDAMPERDAATVVDLFTPIRTVQHQEFEPVFDQGQLGSCTANAALGTLVTAPFGKPGVSYTEADAVALYELETTLDNTQIPGSYPPDDTGSTGPWSMMALERQKRIRSFVHSRSAHHALLLLNSGPISIGVTWFQSMFDVKQLGPNGQALIHVDTTTPVAGGHQVCVVGNDAKAQMVLIRNSWGEGWGDGGHAWLSWADFRFLFANGADAVAPVI